jgi:kynureninase
MVGTSLAYAVALLQVYLEGAEYNAATESWRLIGGPGDIAGIWAIGKHGKPGQSTIYDVHLIAWFNSSDPGFPFALSGTTTDGDGSITFTGTDVEGGSLTIVDI